MLTVDKSVHKAQSAFTKGQFMLDNVVVLHETLYSLHTLLPFLN